MTAKHASSLMAHELELNSNLRAEAFFQDFEKQRAFQVQVQVQTLRAVEGNQDKYDSPVLFDRQVGEFHSQA